jgi:hypothetical protein
MPQVFRVERHRLDLTQSKEEHEVVFGVTSLPPAQADAAHLLA